VFDFGITESRNRSFENQRGVVVAPPLSNNARRPHTDKRREGRRPVRLPIRHRRAEHKKGETT